MASPVSNPPTSAEVRAAAMILTAVDSPISAVPASSEGDATAIASIELNPASFSFSAVAGPMPGSSSMDISFMVIRSNCLWGSINRLA
uniref:Uncharacterized protein n=1 Tax=Candidatus Methanogaster sp. ANME-2c ERB4 TaxID=2759911 RepID=A0A7G9YJW1_9EURY|nr:hypothetical protein EKNHKIJN_00001 [Methanosarcinales archaeon ANME-2c ERB4]